MIVDLNLGGVLIPGLLVLAFVALAATTAMIRCLSRTAIHRLFAYRPLIELAVFVILYGLLVQYLLLIGLLP